MRFPLPRPRWHGRANKGACAFPYLGRTRAPGPPALFAQTMDLGRRRRDERITPLVGPRLTAKTGWDGNVLPSSSSRSESSSLSARVSAQSFEDSHSVPGTSTLLLMTGRSAALGRVERQLALSNLSQSSTGSAPLEATRQIDDMQDERRALDVRRNSARPASTPLDETGYVGNRGSSGLRNAPCRGWAGVVKDSRRSWDARPTCRRQASSCPRTACPRAAASAGELHLEFDPERVCRLA